MTAGPPHCYILLLCLTSGRFFGVSTDGTTSVPSNVTRRRSLSEQCPSFCDEHGELHQGTVCSVPSKPYCCYYDTYLACCANFSIKVTDNVEDNHNCESNPFPFITSYWKTVLGVCLPVAVLCVVGVIVVCSIQRSRQRRSRRDVDNASCRTRSTSDISCYSGSSYSSCRTIGPPPHVVLPATSSESGNIPHLLNMELANICFAPPPYTADKPPQYSDIFPG